MLDSIHIPPQRRAPPPPVHQRKTRTYLVPIALLLAGAMVAGTVLVTQNKKSNYVAPVENEEGTELAIRGLEASDWVRGSRDAPVILFEYSDFECPFCGVFHQTMERIMEVYGDDEVVAWVYRHFPIEQLHKQSWSIASAAECAGELGGNDAFWQFADRVFKNTPGGDGLNMALLPTFAVEIGLNREAFNACVASERTRARVQEDYDEGLHILKMRGTPHVVLQIGDEKIAFSGALSYEQLAAIFDSVKNELKLRGTHLTTPQAETPPETRSASSTNELDASGGTAKNES